MKYLIKILVILTVSTSVSAQSQKAIGLADSVFSLKITESNFKSGTVFITLDTVDMSNLFAESTFIETTNPKKVILNFQNFIKGQKLEGGMHNYLELINSPFYESPLIIAFSFNTDRATYQIKIWTDPKDTSKIEGIQIGKCSSKHLAMK
jgi:hypothetical protein